MAAFAVACRSGRFEGVIAIAGMVVCYGVALTSLGLALAVWLRSTGWAATLGVAAHVLWTIGWFFIALVASGSRGRGPVAMGLASASPFIAVTVATIEMHDAPSPTWNGFMGWLVFWTLVDLAAVLLLIAATLVGFDRCLGRITAGARGQSSRQVKGC